MRKLMMLAAMLAMVLVTAAPAMASHKDDFRFDLEFNDNTFQNQEATNNCAQVLAANTGGNDNNVSVYGDKNKTATGSGDIEQNAYQDCDQVIQQAQADDKSIAFNYNDVFFHSFWW